MMECKDELALKGKWINLEAFKFRRAHLRFLKIYKLGGN